MKKEADLLRQCVAELTRQRQDGWAVWHYKVFGGGMQRVGIPDLAIVCCGRAFYAELKADGGRISPAQIRVIEEIRNAGGIAHVIRSVDQLKMGLAMIRRGEPADVIAAAIDSVAPQNPGKIRPKK